MIKQIKNYTFDVANKQITFDDETTIKLEGIQEILNVSKSQLIFDNSDSRISGSVLTNVLTLNYNTVNSGMVDTDKLSIYYDDAIEAATEEKQDDAITQLTLSVTRLTDILANQTNGDQTAVTTTIEHQKIHDGDHYQYGDYQQTIGIGDTIAFVFETPADVEIHITESLYSLQGVTVDIYEGSSNVVGGTIVSSWNNNRTSTKTTGLVIKKDPTSITVGTRLEGFLSGGNKTSGNNERDREFELEKSTIYYFLITSLNNSNAVSWDFNWYEDID